MGARFGYSFLANLGLTEMVAETMSEYAVIAVKLSQDQDLLQLLRQNLRGMMQQSSLMDGNLYMEVLETLYKKLVDQALGKEQQYENL